MIVRTRPNPLHLFFILQTSILRRIVPSILVIFTFSWGVLFYELAHPAMFRNLTATPFALFGIGISIFIAFRNNASYDRWYEARKAWGSLIIESRSIARAATSLLPPDTAQNVVRGVIAFTYALNRNLRKAEKPEELSVYLPQLECQIAQSRSNAPNYILELISTELAAALRKGELTDVLYKSFDERLNSLAAVQGACERILNTPAPFTYVLLLHRATMLLCLILPFGLVMTMVYATPFICALVTYSFLGLDALCDELEQPFGDNPNCLPLNAISRQIEIDLLTSLEGETTLPERTPQNYLLD